MQSLEHFTNIPEPAGTRQDVENVLRFDNPWSGKRRAGFEGRRGHLSPYPCDLEQSRPSAKGPGGDPSLSGQSTPGERGGEMGILTDLHSGG
jgi:hypothetical protein